MAIDLYLMNESPPCRTVVMVAKQLKVQLNLKPLDLTKKDHLTDEFIKINPQHCVPTIVDDGFALWESRAIITYLVNKYASGSSLYPSDPKKRAIIDRLLQFDIGSLYKNLGDYARPSFYGGDYNEESNPKFKESLNQLNTILGTNRYAAGDGLTLADFSLISSLSLAESIDYDLSEWTNVTRWMSNLKKELSYYDEVNADAVNNCREYIKMLKQKKQ